MNARVIRRLVTPLTIFTTLAALHQLYGAYLAAAARNWPFALFYLMFGLAGLALSRALWTARVGFDRAAAAKANGTVEGGEVSARTTDPAPPR